MDTPGIITTEVNSDVHKSSGNFGLPLRRTDNTLEVEIAKTVQEFPNGIHVFIYILNSASPRFTPQDQVALKKIVVNTFMRNIINTSEIHLQLKILPTEMISSKFHPGNMF